MHAGVWRVLLAWAAGCVVMVSPVTALGFLFLTANSLMAMHNSWGDAGAMTFVAVSYATLITLFCLLRLFEESPAGSAARDRARVGVWLATTLLTAMFSFRVSALMPWWPVSAAIYAMGGSTVAGSFYALFLIPRVTG